VAGIWQGHADVPLTEEGEQQAVRLAAALAAQPERPWTRLLSSDLARARTTAEHVGRALGLPVELDARLRERDVGHWSGRTRAEIERTEGEILAAFEARDPDVRPGGGESTRQVRARALAVLRELVESRPGESVIVVSHLGWIRTLAPEAPRENVARTALVAEEVLRRHAAGGLDGGSGEGTVL
jgi:probable phosphoglycerate mutase